MRPIANLVPVLALALLSSLAYAQTNLGELLDAGARRVSAEEFREEIVQRTVVGPSPTGGNLEMLYATSGSLNGFGTTPSSPHVLTMSSPVRGEWRTDDADRICTALQIADTSGKVSILPFRCQYWFKLGDAYFVADSDTDRRAKLLRRTLKP